MAKNEKTEVEILKDKLCYEPDNAASVLDDSEIAAGDAFCEKYMSFLNSCKTEREAAAFFKALAEEKGYTEFDKTKKYKAGDRVYRYNREKSIMLAVFGKKSAAEGVKIAAAHIDSPRLDLKPNPLYEDDETAFLKTHYYGGIKKYQWTAIPLSMHGVVVLQDGSKVTVSIGEKAGEPKFVVTDLLPHLAAEQMKRPLSEGVKGEELNILIGSRPFKSDSGSELVKLNILKLLNEKYGMTEKDFLSAELEMVPAFEVCDIGLDRSMIGGYGHDDRVCAFPSAMAVFDVEAPEYTCITVLTDKEEIGSDGNTGLNSSYFKYFVCDIASLEGLDGRDVLSKSECLSADVNAAYDPTFSSAFEKRNSSFINRGIVVTKYTGARGKGGTSDASAEFVGKVRRIFDGANVVWQVGELGKVDGGGGGTVAKYIADLNVDVVDVGVPVLSMHAPFEVVSKLDVYMAYKGFKSFFESKD
ncbi:MAG: aminopeptidase [Clostridiales bacterium]|nr:aminopeptidase [Clostridiales bacterium]